MGRDDFQVKINGKRIELVGIENAVKLYDPILTCTVIVNDKTNRYWLSILRKLRWMSKSSEQVLESHFKII